MRLKLWRLICLSLIFMISLVPAAYFFHPGVLKTLATTQNQDTEYPWPMYLHDPGHTGYTESPIPRMPTVLWNYTMEGISWGPVVAYGKVFLGSIDRKVYALDQMTGEKMWEFNVGVGAILPSAVADGMVIVSSGDGKLYALNQSDGSKVWDITVGGARDAGTYPAIADGKIYVVFGNTLYAIISSSTLTISVSQNRVTVGSTVTIEGNLFPIRSGASIITQWRRQGETTWNPLDTVPTDAAGHYMYNWRPETEGTFELMAYWGGDASTLASQSDIQIITVELPPPPLITTELLIAIAVVIGVAVAATVYFMRKPRKP